MNNTELEEKLFSDHHIRDIVGGVYPSDAIPLHVKKRPLFRMLSVIYFLSCCILTWIECLICSFVFVVVGVYNLKLLTSSICLVDRYEETPVLQNVYG